MNIDFSKIKYTLLTPGLQIPDEILINLDNGYILYHKEHPPSPLFLFKTDYSDISLETLSYYSDCLAFLHDQPTLFCTPDNDNQIYSPLFNHIASLDNYYDSVSDVFRSILNSKINGRVLFYNEKALNQIVDENFEKFIPVKKEICLYNSAVKQFEPQIEFFMYCRVIESLCSGLNEKWIDKKLNHILSFDYGSIYIFSNHDIVRENNKVDYFKLIKERVQNRITKLKEAGIDVGNYYTNEIRNSIAHGNTSVFEYKNIQSLGDDCSVMKLLCRYGIHKKMYKKNGSK